MTKPLDPTIIKTRITTAREALGLKQGQLAELAGVTPSAISQIENGLRVPSIPVLDRIASVLKVSLDYLTGKSEEPKAQTLRATQLYRDLESLSEGDQKLIQNQIELIKKLRSESK